MGKKHNTENADFEGNLEDNNSQETKTIVIENTEARAISLPSTQKLLPGQNSVFLDDWKNAKRNRAVKMYLECGYLVEKGLGEAKPLLETLDGTPLREAKEYIQYEKDKNQLETWLENTETSVLRPMIEARLAEI